MTEEIKEMLHCIEMNCKHNKCFGGVKLYEEDCKLLLDYITNLQQKLEQYEKTQTYGDYVETVNKVVELQQENKELKAIAEEHKNCTRKHWQEKCGEHHAKELIYKSRCEKAIEYIKENYPTSTINYQDDKYKLINILNGSDE